MPYTLKTQQIAVKDPDTGVYSGVDILTEQTTEGLLTEIIATGTEVKTDVAAQMATERSDFNSYVSGKETELNTYITTKNQEIATMIADADEDVSDLEDRKQDVADAVRDMLGRGVDNTLTTANVPAESKAVGDLFETVVQGKSTQPTDKWNRLWIKPSASDYEIPTMNEFDELNQAFNETADFYDEELGIEFHPLKGTARSTDTPYSENKIIDTPLNANKTYRITWSIPTAISIPVYIFLSDGNGKNLIAVNIPAGDTEYVRDYTPNNDYSNAFLYFTVGNVPTIAVTAFVSMINMPPTRIDELESTVFSIAQNVLYKVESRTVTIANPDVGHYINKNGGYSASSPFNITQSIAVESGETIEVVATGYNNEVAIIAMVKNAYPYAVLVRSISSSEETYSYKATQSLTIVVSYDNRKPCSITIKKDIDIDQISANKTSIENSKWRYAFDRICCIGDSLTSGAYYAGTLEGASIAQNYPSMLSRMLNTPVKNSGRSGASAKTWYTNNMGGLTLTDYGTFVIWLGTNEGLTDTIDTDVDPYNNYNDFADTNTGYLCRTICQIKDNVPDAHIIICTVFATSGDLITTNSVINQVAQKYSLQIIDNSDLNNTNYPLYHSNAVHFNKAGNIFIADRIMNEMINYVATNVKNAEFGLTARTD